MAADRFVALALLFIAAGAASTTLSALLAANGALTSRLIEMTIGTTVFCASLGLAFQRFGLVAAAAALAVSWIAYRGFPHSRRIEQVGAWTSAAAFLAFLSILPQA